MTCRIACLLTSLLAAACGAPALGGEDPAVLKLTVAFDRDSATETPEKQIPAFKQGQPISLAFALTNTGDVDITLQWSPQLFSALDVQLLCDGHPIKGMRAKTTPRRNPETTIAHGATLSFRFEAIDGFNPLLVLDGDGAPTVFDPGSYSVKARLALRIAAGEGTKTLEVESNSLQFKIEPLSDAQRDRIWKGLEEAPEAGAKEQALVAVLLSAPLGKRFDERFRILLQHKSADVRRVGMAVVARYNKAQGTSHFIKEIENILATDPHDSTRTTAAWALGLFNSRSSVPALIAAVRASKESVRPAAIRALAAIGDKEALPVLKEVAADKDEREWVRELATKSAAKIQEKAGDK